jgi:hypothetical protein
MTSGSRPIRGLLFTAREIDQWGVFTSSAIATNQTLAAAVAVVAAAVLAGAEVAVAVVALVVLVDGDPDVDLATVAWTTWPSALKTMFTSEPRGSYLYVFSMSPPDRVFASPVNVMFCSKLPTMVETVLPTSPATSWT